VSRWPPKKASLPRSPDRQASAIVRFLLVAEAGFFPGLVLYFTYWFPTYHHARIVSGFLIGLPIAVAGGAPISTALLGLDGLFGLRGWQIMYIAEGVPTVLIGIVTLFVLTDRPAQAKFLTVEEKTWLSAKLDSERKAKEAVRTFSMLPATRLGEGPTRPPVTLGSSAAAQVRLIVWCKSAG
jgi:ACS family tartrate transporter-like MFS transporter